MRDIYDIYDHEQDKPWRYTLGLSGKKQLITIGLNPSTATQEKSDPTVTRVEQVAKQNGFDGFIMLNLYPERATDYDNLPPTADPVAYERNLQAIEKVFSEHPNAFVWAAWGTRITERPYLLQARDDLHRVLAKYAPAWHHFGDLTKDGHPRHPSRLDYAWKFHPFHFDPTSQSQ